MCGIAGTYGGQARNLEICLSRMAHRGPDGQAVKIIKDHALAHNRLAIVDVTGGAQPMCDAAGSRWLVCNGEIYNHAHLRQQNAQYPFKTGSDSEDILALYSKYGSSVVHHLQGMFAFAVLDGQDIYLARDPLGIKPLYYATEDGDPQGQLLYFTSEIKALQAIVEEVHEFPPGHWYSSREGFVRYYRLEDKIAHPTDEKPMSWSPDVIREALRHAVHTHLMSDVPLGVFLSGGLDSSIIAALVCEEMSGAHSFAVGMAGSADLQNARQAASYLGTNHHEYVYTVDEMRSALADVIYYLESFDPALVRSAIANYFLARLASDYVTVVLSGEGADELFSGYSYLRRFRTAEALQKELVSITNDLHNRNLQRLDRMTMAHGIEGRVPFLDHEFVELALSVSPQDKLYSAKTVEKRLLREAFEDLLPESIIWRGKQKFAEGAGSAAVFQHIAADEIDDREFAAESARIRIQDGHAIRSKEELYYYRIFRDFYAAPIVPLVGFSRSL